MEMGKKKRILLCDDNEFMRKIVKLILEAENYEVETAENTSEVYAKLDNSPDLIILDLNIPTDGGQSVIKQIKTNYENKFPVLIFSASENLDKISEQLGVGGYISKPFDNELLIQKVNDLISEKN